VNEIRQGRSPGRDE